MYECVPQKMASYQGLMSLERGDRTGYKLPSPSSLLSALYHAVCSVTPIYHICCGLSSSLSTSHYLACLLAGEGSGIKEQVADGGQAGIQNATLARGGG